MFSTLENFAPEGIEAGVGLALTEKSGRYVFFLAGTRHQCPPGELFFAGIGGHREPGESWLECAQRETMEEIGSGVTIASSPETWFLPNEGAPDRIQVTDRPRPLALYEMIHPANTPREGELYRLVIYEATLASQPRDLPPQEVGGLIAMTRTQVIQALDNRSTLEQLLQDGASMILEPKLIDRQTRLYPLGTAEALATILGRMEDSSSSNFSREKLLS